ncbi:MAG: cell division protein FtsX [Anaeromyxobacter sp.]|nr:cell division protein FtsX [Anaeromyxobacter sp.]MBL0275783.1 cell division protein FtsX [Anaeromyxobacter sp.]
MAFRPVHVTRRALQAMVRGPYVTLTGTATILVAVLVTGLFAAALGGLERLVTSWAGQVRLSVYLAPGADLERARAAAAALAPGRVVEAVPAAEGLRRLAASLGEQAGILEGVGPEAIPDAVEVAAPGLRLEEVRALAARLRQVPGAAEVDYGTTWLERLEALLARARLVGLALLGLLALGTAVLVSNTLRLAVFARREEIQIMKLVGATDAYVGAPFLVEGLLQGLLGGGLAAGVLLALHAALAPRLAAASGLAALTRSDVLPWPLLLGLALGGGAIGLVASALALARHLRRT